MEKKRKKLKKGKPIPAKDIENMKEKVLMDGLESKDVSLEIMKKEDLMLAQKIGESQKTFFSISRKIETWSDFKIAEEMKRLILGMTTAKEEVSGVKVIRIFNSAKKEGDDEYSTPST